jgi:hypothetical protein
MEKSPAHPTNPSSPDKSMDKGLSRRDLLIGIMASVGVVSTVGCVDSVKNFDKSISKTQTDSSAQASDLAFYTQDEFQLVSIMANLIIPDTDTLGALAVGVPSMMDTLHDSWASEGSKKKHHQAISEIGQVLLDFIGSDFITAPADKQLAALKKLDKQAFWSDKKGSSEYRAVKSLIANFYYLSEEGATKELRYELVPGRWEACVPFEKIGRTWAA